MRSGAALVFGALAACASDGRADYSRCFDDQPRPLEVVVDETLVAEPLRYTCEGDAGWGDGACAQVMTEPHAELDGDLNVQLRYMGLGGWWPVIEATPTAARLCGVWFSDVYEPTCEAPVCAISGTVTMSRFPTTPTNEPLYAVVDVVFENGARMRIEFVADDVE